MSIKVKKAVRMLVGGELGYFNEGSIQWYYIMSMVISGLVAWKYCADVAFHFMLLSVLHFSTVYIYGSTVYERKTGKLSSIIFLLSHLILIIYALFMDVGIAFLSFTFAIFMTCVASVMTVFAVMKQGSFLPVVLNLIIFMIFFVMVITLPILWYEKFIFIVLEIIIHPVIDHLQKFIPCVTELADIAWTKVFK